MCQHGLFYSSFLCGRLPPLSLRLNSIHLRSTGRPVLRRGVSLYFRSICPHEYYLLTLRGSQVRCCLTSSSTMKPRCYFAFTFLYALSLFSPMLSIQCNQTQYPWPVDNPLSCCNRCQPGEYMMRRAFKSCEITCQACPENFYSDNYNVEMACNLCLNCTKPNMEFESKCNPAHPAVCRCKAGFKCKDQPCTQCVPMQTTTPTGRTLLHTANQI